MNKEWVEDSIYMLILKGIYIKIQRGDALTEAQQAIKDSAPEDFKWPKPQV